MHFLLTLINNQAFLKINFWSCSISPLYWKNSTGGSTFKHHDQKLIFNLMCNFAHLSDTWYNFLALSLHVIWGMVTKKFQGSQNHTWAWGHYFMLISQSPTKLDFHKWWLYNNFTLSYVLTICTKENGYTILQFTHWAIQV